MISEFIIGRHAQSNTARAYRKMSGSKVWASIGYLSVITGFLITSYYAVVSGWCLQYVYASVMGHLQGDPEFFKQYFADFSSNPVKPILWTVIILGITHLVIQNGVRNGIEKASKMLMPTLFILLLVLVVSSCMLPNAIAGIEFLFKPDFSKVTPDVLLSALGQAFYSMSIGMGCLITYSSYFGKQTNLQTTAIQVTLLDTLVAVLAGVMIFPAVFSFGIAPTAGPELVFITLPNVFEQMPFGNLWSLVFFVLLALAALTSTISLHEVATAYMHEEWQMTRSRAAVYVSLGVLFFGSISSLSMGVLSEYTIGGLNFFDLLDYITAKIMLPLGGMLICLFVGQRVDKKILKAELTNEGTIPFYFFNTYAFFMKYIAPIAIGIIFLNELGLLRWLTGE